MPETLHTSRGIATKMCLASRNVPQRASITGRRRRGPRSGAGPTANRAPCDSRSLPWWRSKPPVQGAELVLGPLEHTFSAVAESLAGTIDVEGEHRHRRAKGIAPATTAAIGRSLQGGRDRARAPLAEDTVVEIQGIAGLGHVLRPPARRAGFRSRPALGLHRATGEATHVPSLAARGSPDGAPGSKGILFVSGGGAVPCALRPGRRANVLVFADGRAYLDSAGSRNRGAPSPRLRETRGWRGAPGSGFGGAGGSGAGFGTTGGCGTSV